VLALGSSKEEREVWLTRTTQDTDVVECTLHIGVLEVYVKIHWLAVVKWTVTVYEHSFRTMRGVAVTNPQRFWMKDHLTVDIACDISVLEYLSAFTCSSGVGEGESRRAR